MEDDHESHRALMEADTVSLVCKGAEKKNTRFSSGFPSCHLYFCPMYHLPSVTAFLQLYFYPMCYLQLSQLFCNVTILIDALVFFSYDGVLILDSCANRRSASTTYQEIVIPEESLITTENMGIIIFS